ncbi:hypothetical protein TCAL_01326 [Tigriopus californicus]|uniref:Neurotransmitter-gated ion-channel ligand-binding domain-containing protein n=1 Tax=Tigriopus californicus TaxID=6832 RepID=A0A553P9W8_TIGCA|nr:neuronal acetylcholine receptor subunit alpha-6-like [Tigriopus californicus]TRY74485.1 hypothetical protein TCAL_01326 [Tigriopus californicus]|eukprot:TCALIF_01326-PA protein Name:"Similar to nAChRalpha2 Acetylcholine receptor subunit alpha-like 2 (Drosophila melanogaster)" AED:0.05 eAED:0.05 QI:40/1/0.66/1/1/1/3/162/261
MRMFGSAFVPLSLLLFMTASSCFALEEESNPNIPSALRKALFADYDKLVKPHGLVTVRYSLDIVDIALCPHQQKLQITGFAHHSWFDIRLRWDPEEFQGIKELHLPSTELWMPDITLYNGVGPPQNNLLDLAPHAFAVIGYKGEVVFVPSLSMSAFCPVKTDNWPWDDQSCTLMVGSWSYEKKDVDIQPFESDTFPPIGVDSFMNPRVEILGSSFLRVENRFPCCQDKVFPTLNLNIQFKEISKFVHGTLITKDTVVDEDG